jgi:hypothetical protein
VLRLSLSYIDHGLGRICQLVLVFVDALADAVLLTVDPFLFGLGQMAVVLRHVFIFAILHAGLALLQVGCLL